MAGPSKVLPLDHHCAILSGDAAVRVAQRYPAAADSLAGSGGSSDFALPAVAVEDQGDGCKILRSPLKPIIPARCVGDWLCRWAAEAPDRPFLLERPYGDSNKTWCKVTYQESLQHVEAIAAWMIDRGLSRGGPLVILSENSINQALITLAAMHVGVVVAPISPAYSLRSVEFEKLRSIVNFINPSCIYVSQIGPFRGAISAISSDHNGILLVDQSDCNEIGLHHVFCLKSVKEGHGSAEVNREFRVVSPSTTAKILFTSGSTGEPKGVINTQQMLCFSQEVRAQVWPFLEREPPVLLDWLPWSHTFGGNHNFNLVLRNGGTLYIDAGKPVPELFGKTIDNLREVESTICFNVPLGFELLVRELRSCSLLRAKFFSKMKALFYAAAALSPNLWGELNELSMLPDGRRVPVLSAWGCTETSPLAADCHFPADRQGVIGLPLPGVEIKLVPAGVKSEIRVRGPNVTPGYWKRDDLTEKAFDEDGFYCTGDAGALLDVEHPEKGLVLDGRLVEDFKLSSGTWVNVARVRTTVLEAIAPLARDVVVTGHGRSELGALIFPDLIACRRAAKDDGTMSIPDLLTNTLLLESLRMGLMTIKMACGGASGHIARAVVVSEPPVLEAGEITDKGYINQRAVLDRRRDVVEALYDERANINAVVLVV